MIGFSVAGFRVRREQCCLEIGVWFRVQLSLRSGKMCMRSPLLGSGGGGGGGSSYIVPTQSPPQETDAALAC